MITGKQFRSDLRALFCRCSSSSSSPSPPPLPPPPPPPAVVAAAAAAPDRNAIRLVERGQAESAV